MVMRSPTTGDNPMSELPLGRELTQHRPINAEPMQNAVAAIAADRENQSGDEPPKETVA